MVFMCANLCYSISDCFRNIGNYFKNMTYKYFCISLLFILMYLFSIVWIILYLNKIIHVEFYIFIVIMFISVIIGIFGVVLYTCKYADCGNENIEMTIVNGYQRSAFV